MYPTYRFNKNGGSIRVENVEEDRALRGEWFDHPPSSQDIDTRFANDIDDVDDMIAEEESASATTKKKKKK